LLANLCEFLEEDSMHYRVHEVNLRNLPRDA
jgi:hypothetical protein